MQQPSVSKKVCMLGSYGVGKSSLVHRYVYNKFSDSYQSTIGVHICQKQLILNIHQRQEPLNLIIWDIAHIEKFNNAVANYFRGAHGAIVVFDVHRSTTFKESDVFFKQFKEINPQSKLIFVGNKMDLVEQNNLELEHFFQFTKPFNSPSLMTSAKTGENVENLFVQFGNLLVEAD